ncbi:flagellar basal body-associated FliL family protein [Roseovarius dicentrarchi]|uniref:flagellar basal body-associated FliL family protein n=1 Tax=Roseovarius dicentrarchi TaxID=2250573 RepID=UPI000DEAE4BD|nr:flagellar basal body-associated FliL family protein [Roseovarius dicentrarchi]
MKFLIPVILLLIGIGGGVGAGLALRPEPVAAVAGDVADPDGAQAKAGAEQSGPGRAPVDADSLEYIKLNNQFIVPLVTKDEVEGIIVMSLSLEIANDASELVYAREPKLRDEFLRVLFNHANIGGFRGRFTDDDKLAPLRRSLFEVAQQILGPGVTGVLITDINRQEL